MSNGLSKSEKINKLKEFLQKAQLDASVNNQTIGVASSNINTQTVLAASAKLIKLNKGDAEEDDRDNLQYAFFQDFSGHIKEHIEKDAGKLQKKFKTKIQQKKNLEWMPSGFFSPQVRSTIIGTNMAQAVEGANPLEFIHNAAKVSKLGQGGISSLEAAPDAARQVHPSQWGFLDPYVISEDLSIGLNQRLTHDVRIGKDGKLYRPMINADGKQVIVDHEVITNSKVEIPEH